MIGPEASHALRGRNRAKDALRLIAILAATSLLAACNMSPSGRPQFSEAEYGVKASPRLVANGKPVPKGGGRYMVGEPYKVRGEWFRPADNPSYKETGVASWYGSNFHGRQTANGEIYDMASLTAAHPTLPLPSYVRVTNLANGRSVVVRVNDRGPFSKSRVIDVSAKAAEMLGFIDKGLARVEVDYIGRARMDGHDGVMLMASYSGPNGIGRIGDEQIMLASLQSPPMPSGIATGSYAFAANSTQHSPYEPPMRSTIAPNDPIAALLLSPMSSYAAAPVAIAPSHQATAALAAAGDAILVSARQPDLAGTLHRMSAVQIGVFASRMNADRMALELAAYGVPSISETAKADRTLYSVRITVDRLATNPADVIAAAKTLGARGAFVLPR